MSEHREQPHQTEPMPVHLDEWHQHTPAEGEPREEHAAHANITVLLIAFVVITIGTAIFSVIIGVYAIGQVNKLKTAGEGIGLAAMNPVARGYKEEALEAQATYGWTPEGNVRLPIEQAMRMVVEQHQEQQSP